MGAVKEPWPAGKSRWGSCLFCDRSESGSQCGRNHAFQNHPGQILLCGMLSQQKQNCQKPVCNQRAVPKLDFVGVSSACLPVHKNMATLHVCWCLWVRYWARFRKPAADPAMVAAAPKRGTAASTEKHSCATMLCANGKVSLRVVSGILGSNENIKKSITDGVSKGVLTDGSLLIRVRSQASRSCVFMFAASGQRISGGNNCVAGISNSTHHGLPTLCIMSLDPGHAASNFVINSFAWDKPWPKQAN